MMRSGNRLLTGLDFDCEESLRHLLKPELHGAIGTWMNTCSDDEKRGILQLKRMSEPNLLNSIGRPKALHHNPRYVEHRKLPSVGDYDRLDSFAPMPLWKKLNPDPIPLNATLAAEKHEMDNIQKPGGAYVKMTDTVEIMAKKNRQRASGTFKICGGSGQYSTNSASSYNLRSIGQEHLSDMFETF
eukprot:gnl/TRDRNA2_/TRDRNA2_178838_c0_seq1.p1 gnl/TRDRNA2_/TRDRNA2_178838_c0~~gnl/TRDRNA2_/TRDRNA2_178838_c0_seq1.p1  ORF type:complete len:186 (+),score=44.93 gnl/TRDRNA2_/TRDRNA2_178838_c0_seq1:132-689(+)